MAEYTDDYLLAETGGQEKVAVPGGRTVREERIVAGFEEVQRFVATHGRMPTHRPEGDIFERLYAVRLDRLRASPEAHTLLVPLDAEGLLGGEGTKRA